MRVSFFEEFPDEQSLSKLKLIRFPTKLYLAANSYKEFSEIKFVAVLRRDYPVRIVGHGSQNRDIVTILNKMPGKVIKPSYRPPFGRKMLCNKQNSHGAIYYRRLIYESPY